MKRKPSLTLIQYAESYLAERDTSPMYAMHVRISARKLSEFTGKLLRIGDLDCDTVNRWIKHLLDSGLSPFSVCSYRNDILCMWNQAYIDRLNNEPPLRVRKVKKPRLVIECYTLTEIQQLLSGASRLRRCDDNGNRRSDFWQAMIHAGYSSGLRRGDLLNIDKAKVADGGLYTAIQSKTGYPVTVRFSKETLQHAAKLQSPNGLLISWPYPIGSFTFAFKRVRNAAGIDHGSFRWLRRSAGSYAEAQQNGDGARLLGHRDHNVFKRHYEAPSITGTKPVEPPPVPRPVDDAGKEAS